VAVRIRALANCGVFKSSTCLVRLSFSLAILLLLDGVGSLTLNISELGRLHAFVRGNMCSIRRHC
jgi:hypothetical protein